MNQSLLHDHKHSSDSENANQLPRMSLNLKQLAHMVFVEKVNPKSLDEGKIYKKWIKINNASVPVNIDFQHFPSLAHSAQVNPETSVSGKAMEFHSNVQKDVFTSLPQTPPP